MSRAVIVVAAAEVGLTIWLYAAGHTVLAFLMIGVAALTGGLFRSAT